MLTRNHRQEVLSRAYVQIVAATCGLSWSSREIDYGIDMTLHEIEADGNRFSESGFALDVQVKSTSAPAWSKAGLLYDLPVENYNDLRKGRRIRRMFLIVFVLPEDESRWVTVDATALALRHAAYWHDLTGSPPTRNRKSVRVPVPQTQLFTPQALTALIDDLKRGGQP